MQTTSNIHPTYRRCGLHELAHRLFKPSLSLQRRGRHQHCVQRSKDALQVRDSIAELAKGSKSLPDGALASYLVSVVISTFIHPKCIENRQRMNMQKSRRNNGAAKPGDKMT
ncbi:hypothetical protein BDV98DRAFT_257771 [Pterulicium gracile]|uniref:Uncharacterized protein n=1 Tax=Pterulicium gracile TaxID=1884261 RepID=A0A5C3QAX8_9AGAR|nr:hypothetical protein BDV98DRAFT_257771 [Pterula gracilis]